jgi:hypothetical protein
MENTNNNSTTIQATDANNAAQEQRPYHAPNFVCYGSVVELVQTRTNSGLDGGPGLGNSKT